jgi:hypothetical protein
MPIVSPAVNPRKPSAVRTAQTTSHAEAYQLEPALAAIADVTLATASAMR